MQIRKHTAVTMIYTLKNAQGEIIDATGDEPFSFIHGIGQIIRGLEKKLEGKQAGDTVQATINPEDAYGLHDPRLLQKIDRKEFGPKATLEVGMHFHAETDQGVHTFTIAALNDNEVTVDGNHPLAGEILHFDITILEVRDATKEELEHGHVHGVGGHHH